MHSSGVVNTPLLVGRKLKSLTPAELEELLVLACVKIADLDEREPNDVALKPGEIWLHPKYNIVYQPGDRIDIDESIQVIVWEGGSGDCESDTRHIEISVGEVVDYWGGQNNAVAVVKWFLDHGWTWSDGPATAGIERIAAERKRQMSGENWTPEHDDQHVICEMNAAAVCYADIANYLVHGFTLEKHGLHNSAPSRWPWAREWWKPSVDPIRNLEKAGALIAAEIDRLQRLRTRELQ